MKQLLIVLTAACLLTNAAPPGPERTPLTLVKALPVEGPENAQPSGLTIAKGTLFAVSDKHDGTIFEVELLADKAVLKPHVTFRASRPGGVPKLDFEGITCDDEGNFYLVSETAFAVLKVSADGREVSWLTESLQSRGEEQGLFQARGGGLEAIVHMGGGKLLLCAERQARGFIEVDVAAAPAAPAAIKITNSDETGLELPAGRSASFSGLFREQKDVYVVERSAGVISRLAPDDASGFRAEVWSYEHIVNREDLRYSDMRFGIGEGLAMDAGRVYLILDNNGDHRRADPDDSRALLLVMERPRTGAASRN